MKKRFVILDRDGTIILDKDHLTKVSDVELIPNVGKAIKELKDLGLGVIIITNQTVVGNKHISLEGLELIHKKMLDLLSDEGASIDGIYFCPHKIEDNCLCRKPNIELVEKARDKHNFDPKLCFVVGDNRGDIELGKNIGATTILVRTGYGRQIEKEKISPDYVVDNLEAASFIIKNALVKNPRDASK